MSHIDASLPTISSHKLARRHIGSHRRRALIGALILGIMILLCVAAPLITHIDPNAQDIEQAIAGPSSTHILGTDALGRDVFSRLLYGGRTDLFVAVVAVIAPLLIGTAVGAICGYYGGWVDTVLMRIADIVSAFPFYVLVIALVFVIGNGMGSVFVAITVVSWVPYCRLVRAQALRIRKTDYIAACQMGGLGTARIIILHVIPNVLHQALTYAVSDASANIGVIVTLSYFGMGLVPPEPDWGQMLSDGQQYFASGNYYLIVFPALAIVITSFAFSLVGEGLNAERESVE